MDLRNSLANAGEFSGIQVAGGAGKIVNWRGVIYYWLSMPRRTLVVDKPKGDS